MEGFNVQMDCVVEGSVENVQFKGSNLRSMQREFSRQGFEGRYHKMSSSELPTGGPKRPKVEPPSFAYKPRDIEVDVGDSAEFECEVKGQPKPEVNWYDISLPASCTV